MPPRSPTSQGAEKRKRESDDHGDQDDHREEGQRGQPDVGESGSPADMDIVPVACEEEIDLGDEDIREEYFRRGAVQATDDVTGKPLDARMVRAAREDEMAELARLKVYDEVDLAECWHLTGRPPITAKWIDTNKGDDASPKYRSRFVARQIRHRHGRSEREDLFAATPPW